MTKWSTQHLPDGKTLCHAAPTFAGVLAARAAESPHDCAWMFIDDRDARETNITYAQLDRRAKAIGAALRQAGLSQERALMLYPPGQEFWVALMGCFSGGVVAVPTYPPRTSKLRGADRLAGILRDARPAAILTTRRLRPMVEELLSQMLPPAESPPIIATDAFDDALADQWSSADVAGEDLACLQYTSGSTSSPKGVMLTHDNLLHNARVVRDAFGHTRRARGVLWLPSYHDMGLNGMLQAIYAGFPMGCMSPTAFLQRPLRWLQAITKHRVTTSGGPNFAYELCTRAIGPEERKTLDLSSWDVAFNGAEPIDPQTLERFAEAFAPCGFRREAFFPCYGLAESTLMVSGGSKMRPLKFAEQGRKRFVGCGGARNGMEIAIVDPAAQEALQDNAIGEIWVSGPSVARGYWNRPEETKATFEANLSTPRSAAGEKQNTPPARWLRTGDLGFVREGELFITGRLKDLIIIRGVNHYPQDIERTVAASHPALRAAGGAAFSIDADGPERLIVLQEIERSRRADDPAPIFAAIRQAISERHELDVRAIVLLRPGQIPKTSSGKVRHYACRQAFLARELETIAEWHAPSAAPAAASLPRASSDLPRIETTLELETYISQRLAALAEVDAAEIDPAEPFARYGVDSVKAAALAAEIGSRLGCEVPLTLFWDYPSPAALAHYLFGDFAAVTETAKTF